MKIVAFNGSPREKGNTHQLIQAVFKELEAKGIETEEVNIARNPVRPCLSCGKCRETMDQKCIISTDNLNDCIDKMLQADGIILGSPVYVADVSGQMKSFIDRVGMVSAVNGRMLKYKVGASVVAARRAGALPAFHTMNSFFSLLEMVVVGSSYWNMGYGMQEGDVQKDLEGMQTMQNLGRNMAWLIESIKKADLPAPDSSYDQMLNFIR